MLDCETPPIAKGLCRRHYARQHRTGDPLGLRRTYAPIGTCAHPECNEPVKLYEGRPRRFCSLRCYRSAGGRRAVYAVRTCHHCGASYTPRGTKQRWCWTCLGEPVTLTSGVLRYPGGRLLKLYGLSWPEWMAMLARHDGQCWICLERPASVVDHDHETGKARGALCGTCNTRLHREVDSGWLTSAMRYLTDAKAVVF